MMTKCECAETFVLGKAVEGADFCCLKLLVATVFAILQVFATHALIIIVF